MKIKLTFLSVGLILLLTFAISVSAQKESIETLLQEANERLNNVIKQYKSASAAEKKSLRQALADATDEVNFLKGLVAKESEPQPDNQSEQINTERETQETTVPLGNPVQAEQVESPQTFISGDTGAGNNVAPRQSTANQIIDDCNNRNGVYNKRICQLAQKAVLDKQSGGKYRIRKDRDLSLINAVIYGNLISDKVDDSVKKFLLDAEEVRTDKQIGTDAMAKGTTSIVVKGGIPTFFNLAYENGAATRTISGSTVTFRVNPVGFTEILANKNLLQKGFSNLDTISQSGNDNYKYLRKLSLGFAFDTNRGQDIPTLTASEQQLSAFSARYEFINERNPRHEKYADEWRSFFVGEGGILIERLTTAEQNGIIDESFQFKNPLLQTWLNVTNTALDKLPANSSVEQVESEIRKQLLLLPIDELKKDPALLIALNQVTLAFIDFRKKEKVLLNKIAKAPIVSFEYTNYREPVLPDTHNFNFIFEKGIPLRKGDDAPVMDLTFNAGLTFFNKKPTAPSVKRINSFNFAGQIDLPLGGVDPNAMFFGSVLSFAGKYQRVTDNATALDGTVLPNTKGDIWVGQTKLSFSLDRFGLTGLKLPISFTFANRTELIRESKIRGNFGLTFDIDKFILSRLLK